MHPNEKLISWGTFKIYIHRAADEFFSTTVTRRLHISLSLSPVSRLRTPATVNLCKIIGKLIPPRRR